MSKQTAPAAPETGKRFFAIQAAAIALARMATDEAIDKALVDAKVELAGEQPAEERVAHLLRGVTSQSAFAAVVLNLTIEQGQALTDAELTRALAEAFPNASVGNRHGKHYMSLARKGRLPGLERKLAIPYAKRATKAETETETEVAPPKPITPEVLCEENSIDVLREMATSLEVPFGKGTKPLTIAKRIVEAWAAKAA
jgi:hypothetical protein